jgi:CoA:oxalate CoA-transferase
MDHTPLEGITVLDLSQAVTGPYAAWLLRGMGARVIKLEGPQGDQARISTQRPGGKSPLFAMYNGGKESMTLNLKSERGREILKQIVPQVDVVIENFVPGTMEGWGLSYEDVLSGLNPRLVYASVSGFGRDSRYKHAPGLDMTMQAMSGVMAATGFPESPPTMCGVLFIDAVVSPHVVSGVLGALFRRERTGRGARIDIAMRDVAASVPFNLYNLYYNTGRVPARAGNLLTGFSPGNLYEARDGHVYIACNMEKQAREVFRIIGRPELIEQQGFSSRAERWANHEEVDRIVGAWTRERTKREVFQQMIDADVPCGMVMDIEEILNDEDLNARGVFAAVEQAGLPPLRLPRPPVVYASQPAGVEPSPFLGEHNAALYRELLGYGEAELARLVEEGVVPPAARGEPDELHG